MPSPTVAPSKRSPPDPFPPFSSRPMKFPALIRLASLAVALFAAVAARTFAADAPFTLEQIMSDPDWIGQAPESPFISADSKFAYYQRKEKGSELRALWRVPLAG